MNILRNQVKKSFSIMMSLLVALSLFTPTAGAIAIGAGQGVSTETFGENSTERSLGEKEQIGLVDDLDSGPSIEEVLDDEQGIEEGNLAFSDANPSKFAVFEENSIPVSVRIEGLGETIVPFTKFNLAPYDITHAVGDNPVGKWHENNSQPLAIHAIVKAMELHGFDVSDDNVLRLPTMYSGNYIDKVAGLETFSTTPLDGWMYAVNNEYTSLGVGQHELQENDTIVLYFVTNFYTNTFTWFDKESAETNVGEEVQFELIGDNYGSTQPIENAVILVNDKPLEIEGQKVVTDAQGLATLRFDTSGQYHISAQRLDGEYSNITRPYSKVIVMAGGGEEKDPPSESNPAPQLSVVSTIAAGTISPTVAVNLAGDKFSAGVTDKANWTLQANSTGLEIDTITRESDQKVTISFKGKAQAGQLSITALVGALEGNKASEEVLIEVSEKENSSADEVEVKKAIQSVSELVLQKGVTSEWEAIGLARAGVAVPESYTDHFNANLKSQVITKVGSGKLKITDVERLTIAAAAIGIDARNANGQGFSLIEKIHTSEHWTWENTDSILYQGNNGIIFALIALDSKGYAVPNDAKWTRDKLVAELLKYQKTDGSWSLSASTTGASSIDITAMSLIALAPYQDKPNAKTAIDKAVAYLSGIQGPTGGFNEAFVGGISSEATSQVIIGLTANNIDPRSEQFTKNSINLIDHLLSFKAEDGGFKHTLVDKTSNGMANEQALQALVAFDLFVKGEGRLYDFGQEVPESDTVVVEVDSSKPFVFDDSLQTDVFKPIVLDFKQFVTQALPEITVERGNTTLSIPRNTEVEGEWDKKIQVPTQQATDNSNKDKINSKLEGKKVSTIGEHIKVGGAKKIGFDQHVTLAFKGHGEHEAGFIGTDGKFELIKKYPTVDAAQDATEVVFAYKDGVNLIIKTKHFTEFLAFKTTAVEPESPGSGGGGTHPTNESVTLSVEKRTMGEGDIVEEMNAALQSGDTAFTLLKRVVGNKGISIDYIGSGATLYVQAIDGLGEFDGGPLSGWMYSVNGVYPDHSAGTYYLNDGDVLRWRYTKDLGHDIGGGYVSGEDKDKDKDKENNLEQAIPNESITDVTKWIKANRDFSNYDHFIDWDVLGLARLDQAVPSAYYHAFEKYVKEQQGNFRKVTDYERMTLAVTAIGKDPRNIAGYDFIEKIYNNERMTNQGTNGVIFALLALDSNNYEVPKNARWTREKLLKWLLEQQNKDGGFPLAEGATSDVDMTAMALQALANYQKTTEVKTATNKALEWLSKQQRVEGGFQSAGSVNSESISQVIIALSSLGIDLSDKRFKKEKGDLRTALLAFVNKDGGISHTKGSESNYMATQQGLLAFIAYNRLKNGENRLYDMTDVAGKKSTIAFSDVTKQTFGQEEIYRLVAEGVISGYPNGTFKPNENLNRGQSAILFARALQLDTVGSPIGFKDIATSSSFFKAANATKAAGIFKGKGNGTTFGATDILTREQMASVLVRAFDLKATNENVVITDMNHVSASHRKDVEILYQNKITMGTTSGKFDPKSPVSRAQFAVFLSRAMDKRVKK